MKKLFLIVGVIAALFFFPLKIDAGRGCCSWHGGQSYCDTSVGRWVCRDGTYSPSCTCGGSILDDDWFFPPPPRYVAPKPPNVQASFILKPNPDGNTFTIRMNWNEVPNTGFSLALHKYAGGDPGPLTDTMTNTYVFYDVSPGIWYADMKVGVNNVWSNVIYWTINVPNWYPPSTPTPLYQPEKSENNNFWPLFLVIVFLFVFPVGIGLTINLLLAVYHKIRMLFH